MRRVTDFVLSTTMAGLLVLVPAYLALLLLLKATKSLMVFVAPLAGLLPSTVPADRILSLLLVLLIAFLVGAAGRTRAGRAARDGVENSLFARIPGYALFRSLTQQLAGQGEEKVWRPALAEIEDALVPAFIIEEHADGRYTVFVPSVPTPLAGAVYVLARARVHPVEVPFTQAIKTVSRVLNGEPNVRPKVHERVLAAVAELGYRPKMSARGLAGGRSFTLVTFLDEANHVVGEVRLGVRDESVELDGRHRARSEQQDEGGELHRSMAMARNACSPYHKVRVRALPSIVALTA